MTTETPVLVAGILGVFTAETLLDFWADPKYQLEGSNAYRQNDRLDARIDSLHSHSLTLMGLVVAAISVLVTRPGAVSPAAFAVLALAAAFLMVSHQLQNVASLRPLWLFLQERAYEHGAFALFVGLLLVYLDTGYAGHWLLVAGLLAAGAVRAYTVAVRIRIQQRQWRRRTRRTDGPTRAGYVRGVIRRAGLGRAIRSHATELCRKIR